MSMHTNVLRLPETLKRVGLARSTLYKAVREGKFPAPILLSSRAVGWLQTEVDAWLEQRIQLTRNRH